MNSDETKPKPGNAPDPKPVYEPRHSHEPGWKPADQLPELKLNLMAKLRIPNKHLDALQKSGFNSYFSKPTHKENRPERVPSGRKTVGYLYLDPLSGKMWVQRVCQADRRCNYRIRELLLEEQFQVAKLQGTLEFVV
jgi:hypothetical protein